MPKNKRTYRKKHSNQKPFLTFQNIDDARPVAKIEDGPYNGKIISIAFSKPKRRKKRGRPRKDDIIPADYLSLLNEDYLSSLRPRQRMMELHRIKSLIERNQKSDDDLYKKSVKSIEENSKREIILDKGWLMPIPNMKTRECNYAAGPSGSGKSTYLSEIGEMYNKMFPRSSIIMFSRVEKDPSIDKYINVKRIMLDDDLVEDPVTTEELANKMVIFDDIETIKDKKLRKGLYELRDDILETGRHHNIYTVITSHLTTNYGMTRTILNECHSITIFPRSGGQYKYCLKKYIGLNKSQIKKIYSLPSRWVTIFKNYPRFVLYSKGMYLL